MNAAAGFARPVVRLAGRFRHVAGWRRGLIAFLLGVFAVAAHPPIHFLPALFLVFPGLVWLLDGAATRRAAFGVGWMFGAGYFAAGLYWVSNALLVDAARFAWLIPFAVAGLSLGLGLFIGATTLAARSLWSPGLGRVLALAVSWTFFEWARGTVLTGFPWNPVGNVWVVVLPVLQAASWIGVYGLSAVTVFAAAALALLVDGRRRDRFRALSGVGALCLIAVFGAVRLSGVSTDTVPGVLLRIVQPNIAQKDKWLANRRAANFSAHLTLSRFSEKSGVTHVIWPETATPFSVTADAERRSLMRGAIPEGGQLITGSVRVERRAGRVVRIWNSMVAVDSRADIAAVYDKHHLVPFGEYMPLRNYLPFDKITGGALDFSAGPGPRTLRLAGLPPFSPLICYEVIFPAGVVDGTDRPAWLLNLTNDAWFGISAGPHQHFASARLRAVEEGLPLVRAANTGISGVVDPFGRIRARLGLGRAAAIDVPLPLPAPDRTMFSRFGNALPGILLFLMLLGAVYSSRTRGAEKNETS